MGTLSGAYTDSRYQSAVPFGSRSHWLQMWRSYQETVPAAFLLGGIGSNFTTDAEDPDLIAQHLARCGIRRARIEVGWTTLDYSSGQVSTAQDQAAKILACQRHGLRPLIVLNANSGNPCPSLVLQTTLAAPCAPGATQITLGSTAGIVPGYTGWSYQPGPANTYASAAGLLAGHLITSLVGTVAVLSRPWGGTQTLPQNTQIGLNTLRYRPFGPYPGADYSAASAGWQRYVRTVAQWAASLLERTGRSDLGFDMEIWNELSNSSEFLDINRYYSPTPYGDANWYNQVMWDSASLWSAYPTDFAGVGCVNGFGNTVPWPSTATQHPSVTGISMHPYAPLRELGPDADYNNNTPINALFATDTSGFEPQYECYLPEYFANGIQTESHLRNAGPLNDGAKGRYNRSGPPCWGWVTEISDAPENFGFVLDAPTVLYWKAKQLLRIWLGWLGKGCQAVLPYAAKVSGGDLSEQHVLDSFLAYARQHAVYPSDADESAYLSPALAALRRAAASLAHGADVGPPPAWGTGLGQGVRAIGISAVSDTHDHAQFAGDGTAAHPQLFDRDCLYLQPVQVNPSRFVLIYYVMTRDIFKVIDPTKTGGAQYDLPDAAFSVSLSGLVARNAQISAYDPLRDRSVPVVIESAQDGALSVVLQASDSPYLLTVQERTSGAVAASSYLQNARLAWMMGLAYPAPPNQYVGLFTTAPTNTTAGTEISAGNYQRIQIGLSGAPAPTVVPTGTAGTTTYYYQIIKKNAAGSTIGSTGTSGSGVTTVTTGNSTLSGSNYNAISWSADAGATSYDVLKWSGTAWTLLGNASGTTMNDTGQATQAYTVPTQNTTGWSAIVSGATETISNALALIWPVANVNWGTAVAMAIFDAATGGNMLEFASLTSSQAINSGSQFSIPGGQLILGEV